MNDLPFFLSEAIVTLYPASADGSTIAGGAVWSGALVNRLRMALAYEEVRVMGSGEAYSTARHAGWPVHGKAHILTYLTGPNHIWPG